MRWWRRSRGYWLVGGSSEVCSYISKCVRCLELRGVVKDQKMADLPPDRLEPAPPFTYCAVDYIGQWIIKDGRNELRRYVVLITCMASRAIHLECVNFMDTASFINALRHFSCRRGPIHQFRSDRGSNFIGARGELKEALAELDHQRVSTELLKVNCDKFSFRMSVPSASHMGGVWERLIRNARSFMSRMAPSWMRSLFIHSCVKQRQ